MTTGRINQVVTSPPIRSHSEQDNARLVTEAPSKQQQSSTSQRKTEAEPTNPTSLHENLARELPSKSAMQSKSTLNDWSHMHNATHVLRKEFAFSDP